MTCPFCELDPKRNPVLFDGKHVLIIPSNPRLVEGHLLVIPKRHIERPSEMTDEERTELFDTVLAFQDKIIEKFGGGCDIREHYQPYVEQSDLKVDHIHFHLIPRKFQDELYKIEHGKDGIFHMMTDEDLAKQRLKK